MSGTLRPTLSLTTPLVNSADYALWQKLLLCLVGSFVLTLSAKTMIPYWPINATLQNLVVVGLGAVYGPQLAVATVVLYLAEGAMGFPVFTGTPAQGLGLAYMMGPSAGFLLGLVGTAYVSGALYQRGWGNSWLKSAALWVCANLVLYIPGMTWLSLCIGVKPALTNLMVWMPGFFAKMGLAAALSVQVNSLRQKSKSPPSS